MKKLFKIATWTGFSLLLLVIASYHALVQWQYSKLPENRSPASSTYSPRIQKLFWHTEFGHGPMEMKSYPFWKVLLLVPGAFVPHGKMPQDFRAAYQAGKYLTFAKDSRSPTFGRFINEYFAAIWISTHWTIEETINTLLERAYFCHDIDGFANAAWTYFGVFPDEMTNEEIVFLSGIVSSPCRYSPWSRMESSQSRAARSLRSIAKMGVEEVSTDPKVCFKRLKPPPKPIDDSNMP